MSYTIRLIPGPPCSACGRSDDTLEGPDPTYNLTEIFHLALIGEGMPNPEVSEYENKLLHVPTAGPRGLVFLSGMFAANTIAIIEAAIARLEDEGWQPRFKALEPDNGWGDLAGALRVMKVLLGLAKEYPLHVWDIC
jgi:hypothetical protein